LRSWRPSVSPSSSFSRSGRFMINVLAAFVLDIVIGDPEFRLHPARLIGSMLGSYETAFYRMEKKVLGGLVLVVCALLTVFCIFFGISFLLPLLDLPLSLNPLAILLVFFVFCNRDMAREALETARCLERGSIEDARIRVGRIVGRDTGALSGEEIARAAVETVAENIVDGFTAPLFYLILGGIPGAYVYKTVNTVDSMFGYRNERYDLFGRAGARLDDALNFIPARLNAVFVFISSGFNREVLKTMLRDGRKHPSPNSGIGEAGFAGFLGVALGGPSVYGGVKKVKPWIGENRGGEACDPALLIRRAVRFYWRVVGVTFVILGGTGFLPGLPFFG